MFPWDYFIHLAAKYITLASPDLANPGGQWACIEEEKKNKNQNSNDNQICLLKV